MWEPYIYYTRITLQTFLSHKIRQEPVLLSGLANEEENSGVRLKKKQG